MTVKEVAKTLKVSQTAVRNYIRSGKLKASTRRQGLRFQYFVSAGDLEAFKKEYLS